MKRIHALATLFCLTLLTTPLHAATESNTEQNCTQEQQSHQNRHQNQDCNGAGVDKTHPSRAYDTLLVSQNGDCTGDQARDQTRDQLKDGSCQDAS